MKLWVLGCKGLPTGKLRSIIELPSYLIMKYQWGSKYSHIAVVDPRCNNKIMVWEAWWSGVRHIEFEQDRSADAFYIEVPIYVLSHYIAWLDVQIGKKYDYLGLVGFLWRSNKYQNPKKWFCSELAATAFLVAKFQLFNWKIVRPHQITPAILLMGLNGPNKLTEIDK